MNYKRLYALIACVLMISIIAPVYAWSYPDCSVDDLYDKCGPRIDRIYIGLYPTQEQEWEDLKLGKIDISDWPDNRAYLDEFSEPPYNNTIKTEYYGPELGYDGVDINCDNGPEKAPGYPNPVYKTNPCGFVQDGVEPYKASAAEFRKALWRTMDRDWIVANVWKGLGEPMYGPCTLAQGPYMHPNATVPVEAGGLKWGFDLVNASAILDQAGFVDTDLPPDGWRNFPVALGGDGLNINLIYYGRSDDKLRNDMAVAHTAWMRSIGIGIDLRLRDRSITYPAVMVEKDFHLYTAGWSIGRDYDSPPVLYVADYYWHPGFCYNYGRVNCTDFNDDYDHLVTANTYEETVEWAWKCQEDFNLKCFGHIFVCSTAGYKSYYRTYTGGNNGAQTDPDDGENQYRGEAWYGMVNVGSYGPDSFWTFLNARPACHETGDGTAMTMRYGFKTAILEKPGNPAYAEWLWDNNILGLVYESLLARDPYDYTWMPWLCKNFTGFTWVDPVDGQTKSGVRFTLREDVTWQDGTPMTAADVEYSLVEMTAELIALGFGPPWWYSNTAYIKSYYLIDPCNIEVLLDIKSYYAIGWIGGSYILPKHIWKPLIEAEKAHPGTVNFWSQAPDPNVIGTGPFRFVEWSATAPAHALMVANKPGSSVKTMYNGSSTVVSPMGYHNYLPVKADVEINDPPALAGRQRMLPGTAWDAVNFTVMDHYCDNIKIHMHNLSPLILQQPIDTEIQWQWPSDPITLHGANPNEFIYRITSWTDQNPDGVLGPCDLIDVLVLASHYQEDLGKTLYFHVEELFPIGPDIYKLILGRAILVNKYMYFQQNKVWTPLVGFPEDVWLKACVPEYEEFNLRDLPGHEQDTNWTKGFYQLKVLKHIKGPAYLQCPDGKVVPNPWISSSKEYSFPFWVTIVEDVAGSTMFDDMDISYPYKTEVPSPDRKVDGKDITAVAKAFGTYPGHPRWNSGCDVNDDYKVDGKDITQIAKKFGWA